MMLGAVDPWFVRINIVEGCFWISLAIIVLTRGRMMPMRLRLTLAATLLLFGCSDVAETRTGGWYKPWWMLGWKTICVVSLLICTVAWLRLTRRASASRASTLQLPADQGA